MTVKLLTPRNGRFYTFGKGGRGMKKIIAAFVMMVLLLATVNCASWSKTAQGAVIGGAAGAIIGSYMDKQAAEIRRDLEGADVQRIGEGIKITFDSGLLFDIDKSDLRPVSRTNLADLAKILNKYADTNILIEGHTDDTGSDDHNLTLSKNRAESVAYCLATLEVASARFSKAGYGEAQPIVTNDTAENRQKNRRVDIAIMANEKLKKAAQDKTKG